MNKIETFGERLRRTRIEAGYKNQSDLADAIGVSTQSISYYERGDRKPDYELFKRLADELKVSYDYLLGESESKRRENIDIAKELGLSEDAINALRGMNNAAASERNAGVAMLDIIDTILSSAEYYRDLWCVHRWYAKNLVDFFYFLRTYFIAEKFTGKPLHINSLGEVQDFERNDHSNPDAVQLMSIPVEEIIETYLLGKIDNEIQQLRGRFWEGQRANYGYLSEKDSQVILNVTEDARKDVQNGEHTKD